MKTRFVELTGATMKNKIFVNAESVKIIAKDKDSTMVVYGDGDNSFAFVTESAETVLELLCAEVYSND